MTSQARRPNKRGRERRDAILAAAEAVFAEQGYRGASLQTIAERVGLSQPGLLHHFPTKEHLFVEILDVRQAEDEQLFVRKFAEHGGDIWAALLAICEVNAATPGLTRLFTTVAAESVMEGHPGHAWFVTRFRRTRALWAGFLKDEQNKGLIDPEVDVELLAAEIIGTWDGLALQWELDPERVDLVRAMADYLARVRKQTEQTVGSRTTD